MKTLLKISCVIIFFLFTGHRAYVQVLISPETGIPHISAALEIRSSTGGLLIPTIELAKVESDVVATNIPDPADGLLIFHNGRLDNGQPSGLPKGLWYYDKNLSGTGKWMIYSRVGSIYSSSIDNFAEMYESRALGSGTYIPLYNTYSSPWSSASEGYLGPGFAFNNNQPVVTELGTASVADQLQISTDSAYFTVDISTTMITSTSGNIVTGQLFVNNIPQPAIFFRHAFQTSGEYINCATSGIIVLGDLDKIDFRFRSTTNGQGIYVEHLNLKLTKIGDKE